MEIRDYHLIQNRKPYVIFVKNGKIQKMEKVSQYKIINNLLLTLNKQNDYEYINKVYLHIEYKDIFKVLKKYLPLELILIIYSYVPLFTEIDKSNKYISYYI